MQISLNQLANLIHGTVIGDGSLIVKAFSPINDIAQDSLVYAEGAEYLKIAEASSASALLVREGVSSSKSLIQVADPYLIFTKLLIIFYPPRKIAANIHSTAQIAEDVEIGKDVFIGAYTVIESGCVIGDGAVIKSHVYIGHEVKIGAGSVIHPHVTIYERCLIGQNVTLHASTVIGCDGFGYTFRKGQHEKTPHVGIVIIEDNVEIGANVAIDRATLGKTVIGCGTKIDNLVQIAHSVQLGKHNLVCAFTGIAGSSSSGDYVTFAADVGVADHVVIEDQVTLAARTGVPPRKTLKKGQVYLGSPARLKDKAIEIELATLRIPLIRKQMQTLTEQIKVLADKLKQYEEKVDNE